MALITSGTYDFAPSAGEVVLNAFSRIGRRGPDIKADMLQTAGMEANFMQVEWNNRGPNLWTVDQQIIPTVPGLEVYPVDPSTVMLLDVRIQWGQIPNQIELTMTPLSRSEYASYPNKKTPGRPTSFWFDRLISPSITLWPVPPTNSTYNIIFYRYRRIQDAVLAGGLNLEIDPLWLDAATAGMSHRLARHYAPQLETPRKQDAADAYKIAAAQNTENTAVYIAPMLGGYYN